jgi:hypothetical protein
MKQNNMRKNYKEFLELQPGSKPRQSMTVQDDFKNKIKKHKSNSNLEGDNL